MNNQEGSSPSVSGVAPGEEGAGSRDASFSRALETE